MPVHVKVVPSMSTANVSSEKNRISILKNKTMVLLLKSLSTKW